MPTLTEIAQAHARMGFHVVPCHGKRALLRWGAEHKEYLSHPEDITMSFAREYAYKDRITGDLVKTRPDSIGAILTPSQAVVLDLDGPEAMEWARKNWRHLKTPYVVKSPRTEGGAHLYYQQASFYRIKQAHGAIAPGVDIKADGSLVVLPGSLHKTGARYIWQSKPNFVSDLPVVPAMIIDWQKKKDSQVKQWDQDVSNHQGFEGTIFYHHVKVFSGDQRKLHIQCPNYRNHSKGDQSGTVLFPANKLGGLGQIHCEHASCYGMRAKDYKHMIGEQACNETEKRILGKR